MGFGHARLSGVGCVMYTGVQSSRIPGVEKIYQCQCKFLYCLVENGGDGGEKMGSMLQGVGKCDVVKRWVNDP